MDRISDLPCNVIDDIFKRLTLHDAARTSILSRYWRYKWLFIPYLYFDSEFQNKLPEKYTIAGIINQVLFLHKGCIVEFVFVAQGNGSNRGSCWPDVDHWLHLLSKHNIELLSLQFLYSGTVKLPNHLFSFSQLKHLYLSHCELNFPSSFEVFGRLVELELRYVSFKPAELSGFISKCPLLEHLMLRGDIHPCLLIDAPNLKFFDLILGHEFPCILKNASILEEVFIDREISESSQVNLIKFLCQLTSVKKLLLYRHSIQCWANGGGFLKLPNESLSHLSHLICVVPFQELSIVSGVVGLLGRSTNLLRLKIYSRHPLGRVKDDLIPSTEYLKEQQKLKQSLCHLKHVEISSFLGEDPEMEFVKLVLSAATSLETLELIRHYLDGPTEGDRMFRSLAAFPRASAKVEIKFTNIFS